MGALSVSWDCLRAGRGEAGAIAARRDRRFAAAVDHARSASPLYRELYAGVPEGAPDPRLLPPTEKSMLMERFDEWVTDPRLTLAAAREFMEDPSRIGERYLGAYTITRSTGTSGELGVV